MDFVPSSNRFASLTRTAFLEERYLERFWADALKRCVVACQLRVRQPRVIRMFAFSDTAPQPLYLFRSRRLGDAVGRNRLLQPPVHRAREIFLQNQFHHLIVFHTRRQCTYILGW